MVCSQIFIVEFSNNIYSVFHFKETNDEDTALNRDRKLLLQICPNKYINRRFQRFLH